MGHVVTTPAGTYRANWRDPTGRQKSKTFKTKKAANAYLAEVETTLNRGTYVDPYAGRIRFASYAAQWLDARNSQATTSARDWSIMRTHVLPKWGPFPLSKVDHLAVQAWTTELGTRLAAATVAKCHQLTSAVFKAAIRDRLIATNPCDDVRLPAIRRKDNDDRIVTPDEVVGKLLPAVPLRYRALVGLAAGTGLRWGECVGLRWDAVDWDDWDTECKPHGAEYCSECRDKHEPVVRVLRVAVEVAGTVTTRPFPKSNAGRRTVPLAPYAAQLLVHHRRQFPAGPAGEIFTNTTGGPMRRTLFRSRVWRPALHRAGLLGVVIKMSVDKWRATWSDETGLERHREFTTEREARVHVITHAANGLRFHDLRHSYATWLISSGVPINDVQKVMGHEQASTTLNRYTHGSEQRDTRVRRALADFTLTSISDEDPEDEEGPS